MNVVLLQDIHPPPPPRPTKISNKNMVESRNCEVRLTIVPLLSRHVNYWVVAELRKVSLWDVTPTNEKYYLKSFTCCHVKPDNDPLEMKYVYR